MGSINHIDEKGLLCKIAKGEEDAFSSLFHLYKRRFYGTALKITRSEAAASEIVQEVFVNIWLNKANLSSVQDPESYLFAITYNVINKHFSNIIREKELKKALLEQQPSYSALNGEELFVNKEQEKFIHTLLDRLPPQQKLIYQLSKQENLSRNEIAAHLQISPNTVKNHLLKAIRYLRSYLSAPHRQ